MQGNLKRIACGLLLTFSMLIDSAAVRAAPLPPTAATQLLALINASRAAQGETLLAPDPLLASIAAAHSREMFQRDDFSHQSSAPGMATPLDRYLAALHSRCRATPLSLRLGENIYYCSAYDAAHDIQEAHATLMHSPGHRANILDRSFNRVGIGIYQDPHGGIWLTEMFLSDHP